MVQGGALHFDKLTPLKSSAEGGGGGKRPSPGTH